MYSIANLGPALVLCLAVSACTGARPPADDAARTLVVASDLDNRPFAWVDDHGTPRGRDVEMMEQLARALGRDLEWRRMPFAELLAAAEVGSVDVVCATLGVTPERAERVLFTRPYFSTGIAVVTRSGAGEPRTLADLAGRRILASPGTTSERAVRLHAPKSLLVATADSDRLTRDRLLAGEADAAALDAPAAEALVAAENGALVRVPGVLCPEHYALALPRDRAGLRDALNVALARMDSSGEQSALDLAFGLAAR